MAEGGFLGYLDPYEELEDLEIRAFHRLELEDKPIQFGGHDFVFVDGLSAGQTCSICLLAMRNPVQTICGHRFCESCLKGTFTSRISEPLTDRYNLFRPNMRGRDQVCPHDRNPIPEYGGFFRDVAWERDILSLRVKCKKSERGCDWTGQLRHYEEHVTLCEYEDVTCAACGEVLQRRLLHTHTTSECQDRIVQCEYCDKEFEFWWTATHKGGECTRFPLDCPQECGVQIPREEVESHVKDDCMMTMVVCPYERAGCTFHDTKSNLKTHLEVSSEEHLNKTWSMLEAVEDQNVTLKKDMAELQKQFEEVKHTAAKDISSLKRLVKNLQSSLIMTKIIKSTSNLEVTRLEHTEWSMLLKKRRLNEREAVEDQNVTLKKDETELRKQFEELKHTAANDQQMIRLLNELVKNLQTSLNAKRTESQGSLSSSLNSLEDFYTVPPSTKRKSQIMPSSHITKVLANQELSQMSGYLKYKKGWHGWKKLWFMLKDNVLYGYKASSVMTHETLPVLRCQIEWLGKEGDYCSFKLKQKDIPSVVFKADDEISGRRWIQELKKTQQIM